MNCHIVFKEIACFELGLRMLGTDFTSLAGFLRTRSRKQMKKKFSLIEGQIPNFLEQILQNPIPFDEEKLKAGGKFFAVFLKIIYRFEY